MLQGIMNVI